MTVEETRFITDLLRAIRSEMSGMRDDVLNLGLRMTAMEQQMLGVNTHLAALQHGVTGLTTDMRRVKQRLDLVDGEA